MPGPITYKTVPDTWKAPMGPYRQAPPEHGGEWWLTNPFTGTQPWLTQGKVVDKKGCSKPGFVELFGPRPERSEKLYGTALIVAQNKWDNDCLDFKGAGMPPGFSAEDFSQVSPNFNFWGLGTPRFFEGKYGWTAKFPEGPLPDFEQWAPKVFQNPDLTIAEYQIQMIMLGLAPAKIHPMVPPLIIPDELKSRQGGGS